MDMQEQIKIIEDKLIRHDERINNIKDNQAELKLKLEKLEITTNSINEKFDDFSAQSIQNNNEIKANLQEINDLIVQGRTIKKSLSMVFSGIVFLLSFIYFIYVNFFHSI